MTAAAAEASGARPLAPLPDTPAAEGRFRTFVFHAVFFLSGFAALLYQMIWQRVLTLFGGADVYSVTLIVTAFMAGLGFGSLAGGHLADRLSARGRLLGFVLAEMAIALFGVFSIPILYDFLYFRLAPVDLPRAALAAILIGTLLWPTFFMGMSLPLLAKALAEHAHRPAERVASLYGWNTVGAALGSLATVWWLLRHVDFRVATWIGVALNVAAALAALAFVSRHTPGPAVGGSTLEPAHPAVRPALFGLRTWILLYALSGFIALSLEIVWFRLLGVILKSNSFTFATLLALYLAGVGLGALIGNRLSRRSTDPAGVFLFLQASIALYATLALSAFLFAAPRWRPLHHVWEYMANYEGLEIDAAIRAARRIFLGEGLVRPHHRYLGGMLGMLYAVVPIFLIGVPTLLMGASFPFLQRAVQTDMATLGRRVGWLQTANIVGSTLGSVVTGLVLLDLLGTAGTLRLLVLLGGVFLLLGTRHAARRRGRGVLVPLTLAGAVVSGAVLLTPGAARLWAGLHGSRIEDIVYGEDASGLSLLKHNPQRNETTVYANGMGQSDLPYGGFHTVLGALPTMIHPSPVDIAIIGLGSGETLFGAGGRRETERVQSIEIVAPQLETLSVLFGRHAHPGLLTVLTDARFHHTFTDGRAFILKGGRKYDIIEADALRPTSAYSGNLYSREYFELLRDHLKPGGFAVTWEPTPRTRSTVLAVFPHVLAFPALLIAGEQPISYDPAAVRVRTADWFTQGYFRGGRVDIAALLEPFLSGPVTTYGPHDARKNPPDVNSDLFPKDEYLVGRSFRPSAADAPR